MSARKVLCLALVISTIHRLFSVTDSAFNFLMRSTEMSIAVIGLGPRLVPTLF